ncbi:MAG: hypothetical protein WKF73_16375 [Nocardioidaceae bacterium]
MLNDDENVCVDCGATISSNSVADVPPPTVQYQNLPNKKFDTSPSIETAYIPQPKFNPTIPYTNEQTTKKAAKNFIWIGLTAVHFVMAMVAGFILSNNKPKVRKFCPTISECSCRSGEKNGCFGNLAKQGLHQRGDWQRTNY